MQHFSIFEYFYRGAANYKAWGAILLEGFASHYAVHEMQRCFEAQTFFIAEQINIPPLYSELWLLSNGPTSDDHVWHSFHALRPAAAKEVEESAIFGTVDSLVQAVRAIRAWDQTLSPHWSI